MKNYSTLVNRSFPQDLEINSNSANDCPACGAIQENQIEQENRPTWYGIGEREPCSLCGANHNHWCQNAKKPLNELSYKELRTLAKEIDSIYDSNIFMTRRQISLNRLYVKRVCDAMALADKNFLGNRFEAWEENRQYRIKVEKLIGLAGEIFGKTAKGVLKYHLLLEDIDEQLELLERIQRDFALA